MSGGECYKTFYGCLVELLVWQFYGGTVVNFRRGSSGQKGCSEIVRPFKVNVGPYGWYVCMFFEYLDDSLLSLIKYNCYPRPSLGHELRTLWIGLNSH